MEESLVFSLVSKAFFWKIDFKIFEFIFEKIIFAAFSEFIKNGIGKVFLSVIGVLIKPG